MEQFVGSVPNPTQGTPSVGAPVGADYSGGALPLEGATTPGTNPPSSNWPYTKRAINPPCSVTLANGTVLPTLVEIHNVQVEGTSCDELGSVYSNICDWTFNVCNNQLAVDCHHTASYPDTMHKFHAEIDMNWTFYKLAPPVPTTGYQVDVQGFAFWDDGHVNDPDHSYSGWELHPLSAWRITNSSGSRTVNMAASPSNIGPVGTGTTGNSTITVTSVNGFTGTITLSALAPYSSGTVASVSYVAASCNPTSVTLTSGSRASSLCSFTPSQPGSFELMVLGSNSSDPTSSVTMQLSAIPDFTLSANPTSVTVNARSPGTSTITLTGLGGFAGVVNLFTNSPSCSVTPTSLTGSGSSTLSCIFSSAGLVQVAVTGTSGSLSHSTTVNFTVRDFTVTAGPTSVNVNAGATATSTITVAPLNGFADTVALAVTTNSTNLVCTLSATSISGGSGISTLSCHGSPAGNYNATVTGTSGTLSHTGNAVFHVQDFTVTASTTSVTVKVGVAGTSTITVAQVNGFTGTVTLAVTTNSTNLPCNLSSTIISGGSGTSTLSCIGSAAGNYLATVTGMNGALSHSATVAFHVQNFTIIATSPPPVNVGQSPTSTVSVAAVNGFAGTVTFSITPSPGLSCGTFTPASITGSGSATVSCSAAVAGNYTATITGTSAPLIHNATATFQFRDFTITATSPAPVNAGNSATSTIIVTSLNHFAGIVSLTDTVPSGLTCGTITPTSVTGSGSAAISCNATVAGNYTLTITGSSGSLVRTATAIFRFQNFTISASSPAPVNVGVSATSTTTVGAVNGFAGTITLNDNVPTGLSCGTITPTSLTGSGTATVSCSATVAGNYTLTVTGTSGSLVHSATALFQFQDFAISASSVTVNAGVSGTSTIIVTSINKFAGTVTLTDTVPSGLTCGAFTPTSIPGSGTAIIMCSATGAGNYTLTVTGTNGSLIHSAPALFRVQDFTTTASSPAPVNVGISVSSTITLSAVNGFTGVVGLTDVPSGMSCGAITPGNVTGSGAATVLCNAPVAGNYTLTVTGTSGSLIHSATTLFQFRDFTITATSPATVNVGASSTSTLTVAALNHFSGTVSLTDTVPSGLTCGAISPSIVTGSGSAAVSCGATLAGNYTLILTGTSGSLVHAATILLQFWDFSSSASSPAPANAGVSAISTVTVTPVNRFNGVVSLTDTVPLGLVCGSINPTSVTGSGAAIVSCNAIVAGNYTLTVTGTSGSLVHNATALFQFRDFAITASAPAQVNAGSSATTTIMITSLNHFAGNVSLTDAVPSGLTCGTINPASLTGSGTATVSCNAAVAGNYTLTVTGTSGPLTHSAIAIFRVQDFTIFATSPASVQAGTATISTITIFALNGFAGTVSFTDTVPANLTCGTITPSSLVGSGTATVSCSSTVAANYTVMITGTNGTLVHSANAIFAVTNFAVSATSPAAVATGTFANSTITVSSVNGFTGTVSLTDIIPSGLSCRAITPSSVTGSGNATLSCSSSAAGNYTLALTGMSGTLSQTATAVFQFVDFVMAATPPGPSNVGVSVISTVAVSPLNHFSGVVSLTDTVPVGLTCGAITPSSITGSGVATVSCNATVAANYTLTITGVSGPLVHTINSSFLFQDFSVSASSPIAVTASSQAASTITVTSLNQFTGTVTLSDTVPSGLTCGGITPSSIVGSGSANISCTATLTGNYTLRVTGVSSSLTHTAAATFRFVDFALSATLLPAVNSGVSATSTITVTPMNNFSATVNLTDTISSGLTCGPITPGSVTGSGSAIVSCNAIAAGNYTLTITGTSGSLSHSISTTFVVVDFAVSSTPSPFMILVGTSPNSTVTVTALNHFNGTVSLTTSSPAALITTLSPSSIMGSGSSTLTVRAAIFGNYTLIVTATSGSLSHTTSLTVRAMDFELTGDLGYAMVNVGSTANMSPFLTSLSGFSGNLTLTVTVLDPIYIPPTVPSGGTHSPIRMDPLPLLPTVSASPAWILLGSGGLRGFTVTISASAGVVAAYYPLIVTATNGTLSHSILIMIIVRDFSLTAALSSVTMTPGTNSTTTLGLQSTDGFFGNATLIVQGPSGGLSGSLSASIVYVPFNGQRYVVLTVQASSATSPGNYTLSIQATSGTTSHTIIISVTVRSSLFATIFSRMLTTTSLASSTATGLASLLILLSIRTIRSQHNQPQKIPRRDEIKSRNLRKLRVQEHAFQE